MLLRVSRDKRAISNIVAYVLLIGITLSLSILVYNWLRFYVDVKELPECPDGVNIIIQNYTCIKGTYLEVGLKNKGLFTVDGYTLRVSERSDADFGSAIFNESGSLLKPEDSVYFLYKFVDVGYSEDIIALIEVQPFMFIDGKKVSCTAKSTQTVSECVE